MLLLLPRRLAVGAADAEPISGREVYLRPGPDCHGRDGEGVARYFYESFYGRVSIPQPSEARVELVRLTNRQYAQAVADLLADPDGSAEPSRFGGLTAAYFKSANFQRENRIHERLEPRIEFDFGEAGPDADGIPSDEFSIRWPIPPSPAPRAPFSIILSWSGPTNWARAIPIRSTTSLSSSSAMVSAFPWAVHSSSTRPPTTGSTSPSPMRLAIDSSGDSRQLPRLRSREPQFALTSPARLAPEPVARSGLSDPVTIQGISRV